MPLSDATCRNAELKEKTYRIADGKGLYLEVHPNGSKYWRLKFRVGGKEKRLAFGVYPEVGLKEARARRDAARLDLRNGLDPSAKRREQKRAQRLKWSHCFELLARDWLENVRTKWSDGHYRDTLKRFEAHVFPELGHIPAEEIDAPTLLKVARKIETKGTIETAHKVVRSCGQVFRFGIASGRCKHNPAADLRGALKPKPAVQHMAALRREDLPDLLRKIDGYSAEGGGELQTQLALQLLALTFVRTAELREATWEEIDFEKAEWNIPGARMKKGHPHFVPLSPQALAAFEKLRELNGSNRLVFPGRNARQPMSKNTILFALYRLGYRGRMTGHGFRAVASSLLNEMNFDPDVIERQLAHRERNVIRAAYHRSEYREERIRMMRFWGKYLDGLRAGAEVIPLMKAG